VALAGTCVPKIIGRALHRYALTFAVFFVPMLVGVAAYGLDALALTSFGIEDEFCCTYLYVAFAFAVFKV